MAINKYKFTIGTTIFILLLILIPLSTLPKISSPLFAIDKLVHLGIFMIWILALRYETHGQVLVVYLLIIGTGFAFSTEFLQLFTKDRIFDLLDFAYDTLGLILGLVIYELLALLKRFLIKT